MQTLQIVAPFIACILASCTPTPGGGTVVPDATTHPASLAERRWTDERGSDVSLASYRGTPLVVTMFYRTCRMRCPMTVAKLRKIDESFHRQGAPVTVVLATLDPEADTPPRLAGFKADEHMPETWHLLRSDLATTRDLNRFLQIRAFKDDNHIDHDVRIAVFDADGTFRRSFEGWDFSEEDVLAVTKSANGVPVLSR